jgi:hypothetical protein
MEKASREGVDWWVMRIATSDDFTDTYRSVRYEWSFADQLAAHQVLDALDDARALQRPPPPKKAR